MSCEKPRCVGDEINLRYQIETLQEQTQLDRWTIETLKKSVRDLKDILDAVMNGNGEEDNPDRDDY